MRAGDLCDISITYVSEKGIEKNQCVNEFSFNKIDFTFHCPWLKIH